MIRTFETKVFEANKNGGDMRIYRNGERTDNGYTWWNRLLNANEAQKLYELNNNNPSI